jgi:glucokinase
VLSPGNSSGKRGNIAVIAAGTGLGEAILHWDGQNIFLYPRRGGMRILHRRAIVRLNSSDFCVLNSVM